MENKKLRLPNVTLVAMTSVNIYETIRAMKYSMREIEFGDAVLVTDKKPWYLPKNIRYSHTGRLDNIDKFNYKMVYELKDHIRTDFCLIVHADGFVIHPENWSDEFLKYDYIGSPWPLPTDDYSFRDKKGQICRVGNSVSIRSKRLLEFPTVHNLKWEKVDAEFYNEDVFICCTSKNEMEKYGIKWAPLELAVRFAREHAIPENRGIEPFAFHKWRGENCNYPRFYSPQKRLKMAARQLLFWRKSEKWKKEHDQYKGPG